MFAISNCLQTWNLATSSSSHHTQSPLAHIRLGIHIHMPYTYTYQHTYTSPNALTHTNIQIHIYVHIHVPIICNNCFQTVSGLLCTIARLSMNCCAGIMHTRIGFSIGTNSLNCCCVRAVIALLLPWSLFNSTVVEVEVEVVVVILLLLLRGVVLSAGVVVLVAPPAISSQTC